MKDTATIRLLNRIAKTAQRRQFHLRCLLAEQRLLRQPSWQAIHASFIVSTGRTGTKSLAQFFNGFDDLLALHEPPPDFCDLGVSFAAGHIGKSEVKKEIIRGRRDALRMLRSQNCQMYIESNNRLSTLIPAIRECFPGCRIIHIVRDGRDVVTSGMSRKWYREDDPYPRIRAVDFSDDPYSKVWSMMSRFERNCWYWVKTNEIISDAISETDLSLRVRFEDIIDNNKGYTELTRICRFLDLDIPPRSSLLLPKTNVTSWRGHPKWESWEDTEQETFWRICGEAMEKYGYTLEDFAEHKDERRFVV